MEVERTKRTIFLFGGDCGGWYGGGHSLHGYGLFLRAAYFYTLGVVKCVVELVRVFGSRELKFT